MNFKRFGNSYHPSLRSADDLKRACLLDESLWVATSAPVHAFRMDLEFLRQLDIDKDQRIKCGELQEAITWLFCILSDVSGVDAASTTLSPSHLNPGHPQAKEIHSLLEQLFPDTDRIRLEDIRTWRTRLEKRPVSETGVVLPDAAEDPACRRFLEDLLSVMEGREHPGGQRGIDAETLHTFHRNSATRLAWLAQLRETDDLGRSAIQPLGEDTASAHAAYLRVKDAVDHFFDLCDAADLDPHSPDRNWPGLPPDLDWNDPAKVKEALRHAPLCKPNPERLLKFDPQLNPAWAIELHDFRQQVVIPLLDRTDEVMTQEIWDRIREILERYGRWRSEETFPEFAALSTERLEEMQNATLTQQVLDLIRHQSEAAISVQQVRTVEKLALYQGLLLEFANNFISFPYLYDPDKRAGFEMGTLIMDGRRFTLSVRVPDRAAYLKNIEGGTMFIMIVELIHPGREEKLEVAVPATSGHQGNLKTGKHGIFQHVDGSQWFATVVHIADNPISMGEAMMEPFIRLGRAVTQKMESITQSAEKKLEQSGGELVSQVQTAPPPQAAPPASANGGNMLAGGGIAIAALGSSFALITKIFSEIQPLGIVKGLAVAILAVLIPSSIIAWMRLRRRDMSVLLEGANWAVNSRMRLNRTQCRSFTRKPRYPEDSHFQRDREWWLWRGLWIVLILYLVSRLL
ncbi:MAG: hypothetical protein WD708_06540 [Kiritimatiellia bacterium]